MFSGLNNRTHLLAEMTINASFFIDLWIPEPLIIYFECYTPLGAYIATGITAAAIFFFLYFYHSIVRKII